MLPREGIITKMESCVQARPRSRSPYDCKKEFEKWKQLQAEQLKRFAPNDVWGRHVHQMRNRPDLALDRIHRELRDREAKEFFREYGGLRLPGGLGPEAKKEGSLWGTVSSWSPKAKRMSKFEPADKSRGSQGAGPVESKPEPPRGSSDASPESVAGILRTSNQLLQAVLQLLQKGPESQGS